jgi:cytochrome c-type biogenesis protein CcmE
MMSDWKLVAIAIKIIARQILYNASVIILVMYNLQQSIDYVIIAEHIVIGKTSDTHQAIGTISGGFMPNHTIKQYDE